MQIREYETREPTGKPPWPITLLAGREKAGKSWACAEASGSDLIGRTFWIGIGEDDPDEYKHVPGARFEIVKHDGTYRDMLGATEWAKRQPRVTPDKPNLIIEDSGTRLWALLSDMGQHEANDRARRKAERYKKAFNPDEEVTIGRDLWNVATSRWTNVLDVLREHDGPSIITARMEEISGTDANGQPTAERLWKIAAQKGLVFDVNAVIEMHARGEVYVTGVKSVKYDVPLGERRPYNNFTMDGLWRLLGLDAPDATAPRQHATLNPAQQDEALDQAMQLRNEAVTQAWDNPERLLELWNQAQERGIGTVTVQGVSDVLEGAAAPLADVIKERGLFLRSKTQQPDQANQAEPSPADVAHDAQAATEEAAGMPAQTEVGA